MCPVKTKDSRKFIILYNMLFLVVLIFCSFVKISSVWIFSLFCLWILCVPCYIFWDKHLPRSVLCFPILLESAVIWIMFQIQDATCHTLFMLKPPTSKNHQTVIVEKRTLARQMNVSGSAQDITLSQAERSSWESLAESSAIMKNIGISCTRETSVIQVTGRFVLWNYNRKTGVKY